MTAFPLLLQNLHGHKISIFKITLTCCWSQEGVEEYVEAPDKDSPAEADDNSMET